MQFSSLSLQGLILNGKILQKSNLFNKTATFQGNMKLWDPNLHANDLQIRLIVILPNQWDKELISVFVILVSSCCYSWLLMVVDSNRIRNRNRLLMLEYDDVKCKSSPCCWTLWDIQNNMCWAEDSRKEVKLLSPWVQPTPTSWYLFREIPLSLYQWSWMNWTDVGDRSQLGGNISLYVSL